MFQVSTATAVASPLGLTKQVLDFVRGLVFLHACVCQQVWCFHKLDIGV